MINKLKKANLVGRGGACFPTWLKWKFVQEAKGDTKYIICNASEGEPGVKKDGYILEHFPERVINGMKIAIDFLSFGYAQDKSSGKTSVNGIRKKQVEQSKIKVKAYIYINHNYHKKYAKKLNELITSPQPSQPLPSPPLRKGKEVSPLLTKEGVRGRLPIELFIKPIGSGYIGGEETSAINAIEEKRIEPRLRPPFPPTAGLWGCPTLVNNVETFYAVSKIAAGEYENKRFYTITGDCLKTGVYELAENWTIARIIKETNNMVKFPFFVQIGGDMSGEVLNEKQLKKGVGGSGSIKVYSMKKYKPKQLIMHWLNFFLDHSCGQCTPCREGVFRLTEIMQSPKPDWPLFTELLNNLEEASFCGLGCVVPVPIKSYIQNVLADMPENKINLPKGSKQIIYECFK